MAEETPPAGGEASSGAKGSEERVMAAETTRSRRRGSASSGLPVAVVGGGPAGLTAAIAAARAGASVEVFDQLVRPGAKLRVSGNGLGNLTNTLPPDEFARRLHSPATFTLPALYALPPDGLRRFFEELGVPTQSLDDFRVYPVSHRAEDLLHALLAECARLGVTIRAPARVTGVTVEGGRPAAVVDASGSHPIRAVVIATGGLGYPRLGGTGDGYRLARQLGHSIVTPVPALVALVSVEEWPRTCAGVTLRDAHVWIDLPKWRRQGTRGGIVFTHDGVSGPAVLDISARVARLLLEREVVPLRINLTPGVSSSLWADRIDGWCHREGAKTIQALLARTVPRSFAAVVCGIAGIDHVSRAGNLDRATRERLVAILTGVPLRIRDTEGFSKAMATSGGVATAEINRKTMESRIVRGVYFAGEVIDVDGPTGGFNLHWAFASGWLAGHSAASSHGKRAPITAPVASRRTPRVAPSA